MKRDALIILGLIAITLVAYSGLRDCGFVNFDDMTYIVNNRHVTGGLTAANFNLAWTTFEQGLYVPLTSLSLMLNATLFGPGAQGFHWVNLAFHIANSVLVYLFFRQATGAVWRSALVAAIFAVHPLHVESVAWAIERKDVLSGFFGLLTMLAYLRYVRSLKWTGYAMILLLFAATLLAKQSLTTLPFLLLLMDYWPLGRWGNGSTPACSIHPPRRTLARLVVEKLPLLAMTAVVSIVAMSSKQFPYDSTIVGVKPTPLSWRLANIPVSYVRYLGKMVWFGDLAVFYPRRAWNAVQVTGACLLLGVITSACFLTPRSRPWLTVGWLWFVGVLVPMIGLVQIGGHALADRYTYIAGIGVSLMVVWSIPARISRKPVFLAATVGTVLGLLIVFTMAQTRYWQNSMTLFERDIDVAGSNPTAELNLGVALLEHGELSAALGHLRKAVNLDPQKPRPHWALALALTREHRLTEAVTHSRLAVTYQPENATWRIELADLLCQTKQYEEASRQAGKAISLDPESAEAHRQFGRSLCEMGKTAEGIEQLKMALAIQPGLMDARQDLRRFQNSANQR